MTYMFVKKNWDTTDQGLGIRHNCTVSTTRACKKNSTGPFGCKRGETLLHVFNKTCISSLSLLYDEHKCICKIGVLRNI